MMAESFRQFLRRSVSDSHQKPARSSTENYEGKHDRVIGPGVATGSDLRTLFVCARENGFAIPNFECSRYVGKMQQANVSFYDLNCILVAD